MRRFVPYIVFASLTGFTATNGLPVLSGDCNSHMNKKAVIKCAEDDTECKNEKAEKFELGKTVRS